MRALIVGSTGFVGERLSRELIERGHDVACVVRDPEGASAAALADCGCELRRADLTDPASLETAVADIDVVYYLAHLMAANGQEGLIPEEEDAARSLGRAAKRAGVGCLIYLGGLGDPTASEHLRARHRTAEVLRAEGPPLTYLRAAMVVGERSGSYVLLKSLVERAPALPSPEWLENRTQPIGVEDVVAYLADAPAIAETRGREIELGGPELMTYSQMLEGMAAALGEGLPWRMPAAGKISPRAAGRAAGAISRGEPAVAELLTAGLATDTVVTDPSGMELFEIEPEPYRIALARAVEDEFRAEEGAEREAR